MKKLISLSTTLLLSLGSSVQAEKAMGTLLFKDDFERSETDEAKEEIGNGWATNSKKRAKGNKQVDLRDGAMYIYIHEAADHGVSVTHPAEFQDGAVSCRFMLEDKTDSLGLNFADLQFKEVHAGHLCAARIFTNKVLLQDLKDGTMSKKTHDAKKAKTLTKEQKKHIASKTKELSNKLAPGKWYHLLTEIDGTTLKVSIDGKEVGSFTSNGIGHPTKRLLRLAVPKNAVVDDLKVWKRK